MGWIGSASTAPWLSRLRAPLARLASATRSVELELVSMGGEAPDVAGMSLRSEPWTEAGERKFLAEVDIGLMPLPNSEWARGKCSYKALQYMAAGIPVVADDVGISAKVVGHGEGGLVAGDAEDWVDHLTALVREPALRERLGATGRARVKMDYSVERWGPRLASILRGERGHGA